MTLSERIKDESLLQTFKNIGKVCFFIGISIELLVLILEKSSYTNPVESWMFRIAFGFFVIKCLCTKYSSKDIILIAVLGIVSIISYKINTRDELVRIAVFVVAVKDMDFKKVLKYVFWISVSGTVLLMILSVVGVLGTVVDPGEGYGIKEGMTRYCFGLGSANTLSIMVWALMLLGIYVYHEKMKLWHYLVLLILSVGVYLATVTRTSFITMVLSLIVAFMFSKISFLKNSKIIYILGAVTIPLYVACSVWAAKVSAWHEYMTPFQNKLDDIFTGRISCLYAFVDGGGRIENWLLFSKAGFEDYFDMGYVRMFYWYGIVPTTVMLLILIYMVYKSYRLGDYMGFVVIMIICLFNLFEAHFVSVYIARNYLLVLAGVYLFSREEKCS